MASGCLLNLKATMTRPNRRLLRDNKRLTRENVIYAKKFQNCRLQIRDMRVQFFEIEQGLRAEIERLTARLPVLN